MHETKHLREQAVGEIESFYRQETMRVCSELYESLYSARFSRLSAVPWGAHLRYLTGGARLEAEPIFKDSNITEAVKRISEQPFHPIFLGGGDGKFAEYNTTAACVFENFELSKDRRVRDLYDEGMIFRHDDPGVKTSDKDVFRAARKERERVDPDRPAWTQGNELVFFRLGRDRKRLLNPVTARLFVTTLHHKDLGSRPIGTMGVMTVPLYLQEARRQEPPRTVFVSMPFAPDWSRPVYSALQCGIRAAGYEPIRVDEQRTMAINTRIRTAIEEAAFVIADVTDGNPNVMHEVGYANGIRKDVILITQSIHAHPFNLVDVTKRLYDPRKLSDLSKTAFEELKGIGPYSLQVGTKT
jgi:hypothetical protein